MDTPDAHVALDRQERRDARANHQRILAAAKQLFAIQGVAATTMKDIAEAAGVGKGTLYRHFAHKGEVCAALLRDDVDRFQQRLDMLFQHPEAVGSPLARLDILLTERIRMTETHLPLFAAMEEVTPGTRPARPFRGPFAIWTHARIVALLDEAIARGEVMPLDAEFTADAILETISPPVYRYQRHTCGYSIERIIAGVRRLFIDGLRCQPRDRPQ